MKTNSKAKHPSPCLTCARVPNPRECENKLCKPWRQWFLDRWELIHAYPRQQMDQEELQPQGVTIGGKIYTHPDHVRNYLGKDPCDGCICPKDICKTPCKVKRTWQEKKEDVFL